jgi:uncharacterized protein YcaQ
MESLAPAEARRIVVARQEFAVRRRVATPDDVLGALQRLDCVQIDSVTAVARAHRLTLAARVGRIPPGTLNGLRRSGRIAEAWVHEASLIPATELPWYRAAMLAETEHRWYGPVLARHRRLARTILRRVEAEGPLVANDVEGSGRGGWWEWSDAKKVLEALFSSGRLAVRERRGFTRVYDLPERLYAPEHLEPVRDADAVLRRRVERAVRSRGLVTASRIADYHRVPGGARTLRAAVEDLATTGAVVRARVGPYEALVDPVALETTARPTGAVLLCPFDNLIWDREEADRLFGFRHALEIYTPAPKRRWGYYVLPLLVDDRVVGRVDLRADRGAGVLRVLAVHWEGRPSPARLRQALVRLAWTLGLEPGVPDGAAGTSGSSPRPRGPA